MSPARDRPRDRYCRRAISRMHADSGLRPTSHREPRDLTSSVGPLFFFFLLIELLEQLAKPIRDPRAHDIVVHGPELLTDLALDIASKPASGLSLGDFCLHRFGPAWLVVVCHCCNSPPACYPCHRWAPFTQWGITRGITGRSSLEGTFLGPCVDRAVPPIGTWRGGF